jgi:hypothetical protein
MLENSAQDDPLSRRRTVREEHPTHREFTRVLAGVQVSVEISEGNLIHAETQNVSMKGTLVLTNQRLPIDTLCEVTLHLDQGAIQIRARGRVARLYPEGIAIEFDKLDGLESYEHLKNLVRYNAADLDQVEDEIHTHLGIRKKE